MTRASVRIAAIVGIVVGFLLAFGEISGLYGYAAFVALVLITCGSIALLALRTQARLGVGVGILALVSGAWVIWIDPVIGYEQRTEVRTAQLILGDEKDHRSATTVRLLPEGPSWQVSFDPRTPCARLASTKVDLVVAETRHWGKRVSYGPIAILDSSGKSIHCIRSTSGAKP